MTELIQLPATLLFMSLRADDEEAPAASAANFSKFSKTPGDGADEAPDDTGPNLPARLCCCCCCRCCCWWKWAAMLDMSWL